MKCNKKEIVKMLLNQEIDKQNEEELMDMLVDNPISVDIDKLEESNMKFGDKVADKITEFAGSWGLYHRIYNIFNILDYFKWNYISACS